MFYLKLACEDIPSVEHSTSLNSNEVFLGDKMVEGFEVTYTCADNFKQTKTKSTCDREGKWSPTVVCLPGMWLNS